MEKSHHFWVMFGLRTHPQLFSPPDDIDETSYPGVKDCAESIGVGVLSPFSQSITLLSIENVVRNLFIFGSLARN